MRISRANLIIHRRIPLWDSIVEILHLSKLSFCEMKYQMIMARSLPEEVTQGTLEGDIVPGDITFYRLQSTSDNKLRAYIAQGEVLPVATRSFGCYWYFCNSGDGTFLPPRIDREELPASWCSCIRTLRKSTCLKYLSISEFR